MPSFNQIVNPFTLKFHNNEIEEEYYTNKSRSATLLKHIFAIMVATSIVLILCILLYLMITKLQDNKTEAYSHELISIILLTITSSIEIFIYFSDMIKFIRGSLLAFAFIYLISELPLIVVEQEIMISLKSLFLIIITFAIGCVYTRKWMVSAFSLLVGIIIFTIKVGFKNIFLSQITIINFVIILFLFFVFGSYLFYFLESSIRNGYFAWHSVHKKKEKVENLLSILPIPIVVLKNDIPKFVNSSFTKLFELSNETLEVTKGNIPQIAQYLSSIIDESTTESLWNKIKKGTISYVRNRGFSYWKESTNEKLTIKVNHSEIMFGSDPKTVLTLEDISAYDNMRRKIERRYQSMLISTFAHEIRTPVNGCIGIIEKLLLKVTENSSIKKINSLKHISYRLIYFVDILHIFGDIQTNCLILNFKICKIENLVREVTEIFRKDLKIKDLNFSIKFINTENDLEVDYNKLQVILFILIHNAIKYTIEGNISIKVMFHNDAKKVIIKIKDTGIGISEDKLESIFEVVHADPNKKRELNPQGMGFSLFVAKKLSQAFGGDLNVKSELKQGTTFKCIFPFLGEELKEYNLHKSCSLLAKCALNSPEQTFKEKEPSSSRGIISERKKCRCSRFLIVDDEPLNIMVLKNYLKKNNEICDMA